MPVETLPKELKNLALDREAILKISSSENQKKLLEQMGVSLNDLEKVETPEEKAKKLVMEGGVDGEEIVLLKRRLDRIQELLYRVLYLLNEKIEQDKKFFQEFKAYPPISISSDNATRGESTPQKNEESTSLRNLKKQQEINPQAVQLENFFKFTS